MSDRVRLDWRLSADVYSKFKEAARDKLGGFDGYASRAAARAMREFIDSDDYAALESKIDRLVQAAGRTPEKRDEKNLARDTSGDRTRICARVSAELKERFKSYVDQHTDLYYGQALERAFRVYLDGGRAARLERKLDRVVDDAEAVLSEVTDNGDLTHRERKTIAVCKELGDEFTRDELEETIRDVAGVDSDPSIKTYTERVIDRLDVVEHPNNSSVLVPEDTAAEIAEKCGTAAPDAPAIDRKDYQDLSREEKIHGVRLELARRAADRQGKARFRVEHLREHVFGPTPTSSHLSTLLEAAGDASGYRVRKKRGKRVLDVALSSVQDPDILDTVTDPPENPSRSVPVSTASSSMANSAQAVADGGRINHPPTSGTTAPSDRDGVSTGRRTVDDYNMIE